LLLYSFWGGSSDGIPKSSHKRNHISARAAFQRAKSKLHVGHNKGNGNEQQHRIAIVIPYVASGDDQSTKALPPYFDAFCAAARGSASLVDFLIFHNGIPDHLLPPNDETSSGFSMPSNVKLINLADVEGGMAELFLRVSDEKKQLEMERSTLIRIIERHISLYPYVLVEFKAAMGHIFADYLQSYSHWGYSDLDILFGDMPRWITPDELTNYDIVTYGYGDQDRLYLRGQFTIHKNTPKINQLWRGCDFLSDIDGRFSRAAKGEKKLEFESAEGCYSAVVLKQTDIRIKYAVKALTDEATTKDGTQSKALSHGVYISFGKNKDRSVIYTAGKDARDGEKLLHLDPNWFETSDFYSGPANVPLQQEYGERVPIKTARMMGSDHAVRCMFWAPKQYQPDLCAKDVAPTDTVFLIDGVLYKQAFRNAVFPAGIVSLPFFHFQEWKRYYRSTQLSSIYDYKLTDGFAMFKEGMVPLLPAPSAKSRFGKKVIGKLTKKWKKTFRKDGKQLPSSQFCLLSSKRNNPPAAAECNRIASWLDESQVNILSGADRWDKIDIAEHVTLTMTLQIRPEQVANAKILQALLDVAESNIKIWSDQYPSVLLIYVAGSSKDVVDQVSRKFSSSASYPKPHLDRCLVGAIFSSSPDNVSRKALMNMASAAAPTRFVITGMELERGLLISKEASQFATRSAIAHQDFTGDVFILPQFAVKETGYDDVNPNIDERHGAFPPVSVLELVQDPANHYITDVTTRLHTMDCDDCSESGWHETIQDKIHTLWYDMSASEITGKVGNYSLSQPNGMDALIGAMEDLQLSFMELLTPQNYPRLRDFDPSPILMVDRFGPREGMMTFDLVPEVEEFGGWNCFNALRLAQLAAFGYRISVLPGAFAASLPAVRGILCTEEENENEEEAKGSSRCDGCFMFNDDLIQTMAKDERERPIKAAVLWNEQDIIRAT